MPVTLESRTRRMQVFHLAHDLFCRDRCACTEVAVVVVAENPRTGERAPKHLNKKVPGSITFLALERKPGLLSAVLELAQVKAAIGRGYLRVVEQTPDQAAAPAAVAAVPASPVHSPAPAASTPPPAPAASSPSPAPSPAPAATSSGKEP
jgi:hypothetical protein